MAATKKFVTRKFVKEVDSGPLDPELDKETAQTVQDERIRRQVAASAYPNVQAGTKPKKVRAAVAKVRAGY